MPTRGYRLASWSYGLIILAFVLGSAISFSLALAGPSSKPHSEGGQPPTGCGPARQQPNLPYDRAEWLEAALGCSPAGQQPEDLDANRLEWVTAISANDVWAVGYYWTGERYRTLAEHWDGNTWSIVPTPDPGWVGSSLIGVSATSADDVWAVGSYYITYTHALAMHWNGSAWSVAHTPDTGGVDHLLNTVTADAPNDAWAVGYFLNYPYPDTTLVEHWDGTQWSIFNAPDPGDDTNYLFGADAISPTDVWAVGYYRDTSLGMNRAITGHWNGSAWDATANPYPGRASYGLGAAKAISTNDVWAVGSYRDGYATLAEHWDGAAWTMVASPSVGTSYNYFYGADAVASNDVWAVGRYNYAITEKDRTLIEHWNGSAWSISPSPNVGAGHNKLIGVAATSSRNAWAVGYFYDGNGYSKTLAEHWDGNSWSVVASPNPGEDSTPTPTSTPMPTATPTPRCAGERFSDVCPGDYFYTATLYLSDQAAISGYADGTFRPYNNTTRAQLTKIIVLAEGWPLVTPTGTPTFSDVPAGHPFYQYVEMAADHGIISGYADGTFRPGNDITRSQLCKVVVAAEGWSLISPGVPTFTDVPPTHPFYREVETAYCHAIISGYANGTFRPGVSATRGQIAVIVYRALVAGSPCS